MMSMGYFVIIFLLGIKYHVRKKRILSIFIFVYGIFFLSYEINCENKSMEFICICVYYYTHEVL